MGSDRSSSWRRLDERFAIDHRERLLQVRKHRNWFTRSAVTFNLLKSAPKFAVEAELYELVHPRTLRHRFDAIASLDGKAIGLRSRKGSWTRIDYHPAQQSIVLSPAKLGGRQPLAKLFDRNCSDPAVGYSLRAAVWDEGSLAFLDSRGMLHLSRRPIPTIPEMTPRCWPRRRSLGLDRSMAAALAPSPLRRPPSTSFHVRRVSRHHPTVRRPTPMLTLPLTIRYSDSAAREAAAWFIPGGESREWLAELVAWQIPLSQIALHLVPMSRDDRRPRGVLAVPQAGHSPRVSNRCQPYGRVARRLYIPVEAVLGPDVDDQELAAQLSVDAAAYVMHPAAGLIQFAANNVLRVSDLLAAPNLRAAAWDCAVPGVGFNRRLLAVQPEQGPDLAAAWDLGRDDIGSESPTLDALPPSPMEPRGDPISRASGQVIGGFAKMVQWLAQWAPKFGGKPTWVNKLADWAKGLSERQQQSLDDLRNREILRLLHLLEAEPDEGLRFALPFDAEPHRGLASPSARLGEREVNFDLRHLGGGKPADFWRLREEHRRRLTTRYRELANREVQLGRHRRAAYIYAKLLGDYAAAANTLAQGHHYREAAAVYRDKLKRPLDAARCLENGGLVNEAIAAYGELAEFEKVGDLYVAIDQPDNARAAYLQAVEQQRSRGDHLHAARLLEEKLAAPDDALIELAAGWPTSPQAGQCLEEQFHLFARLGRHADAERRIDTIDVDRPPGGRFGRNSWWRGSPHWRPAIPMRGCA